MHTLFSILHGSISAAEVCDRTLLAVGVLAPLTSVLKGWAQGWGPPGLSRWHLTMALSVFFASRGASLPPAHIALLYLLLAPGILTCEFLTRCHSPLLHPGACTFHHPSLGQPRQQQQQQQQGLLARELAQQQEQHCCSAASFAHYALTRGLLTLAIGLLAGLLPALVFVRHKHKAREAAAAAAASTAAASTKQSEPLGIHAAADGGGSEAAAAAAPSPLPFQGTHWLLAWLGRLPFLARLEGQLLYLTEGFGVDVHVVVVVVLLPLCVYYFTVAALARAGVRSLAGVSPEEWLLAMMACGVVGRMSTFLEASSVLKFIQAKLARSQNVLHDVFPEHVVEQLLAHPEGESDGQHATTGVAFPASGAEQAPDSAASSRRMSGFSAGMVTAHAQSRRMSCASQQCLQHTAATSAAQQPQRRSSDRSCEADVGLEEAGDEKAGDAAECVLSLSPPRHGNGGGAFAAAPGLQQRQNALLSSLGVDVDAAAIIGGRTAALRGRAAPSASEAGCRKGPCSSDHALQSYCARQSLDFGDAAPAVQELRRSKDRARVVSDVPCNSITQLLQPRLNMPLPSSSAPSSLRHHPPKHDLMHLAKSHECVTVLFSDLCGFSTWAGKLPPEKVMHTLNTLFTRLDEIILHEMPSLYKIETIGDAYVLAANLVSSDAEHAATAVRFAVRAAQEAAKIPRPDVDDGSTLQMRIGLHSGPVASGVCGVLRRRFCMFGDTVNMGARTETSCLPGGVQLTAATYELAAPYLAGEDVRLVERGEVHVKGADKPLRMYLVAGEGLAVQ